jgi:glycosyltransferase involved in cell wall biosynthesis
MPQPSPSYRIVIPTRDAARHIGAFLEAYRNWGLEPLYIVNTLTVDGTAELLRGMKADVIDFTPSAEYAEAGFMEFGARHADAPWICRMDDDEFPSQRMLEWMTNEGCRSLNPGWQFSRRELFTHDGEIWTSRRPGRYNNPHDANFLNAQVRLFNASRVSYLQQIHTSGFANVSYFGDAPQEAFFIHCNCLLRSPAERLEKIRRYEAIKPLSCWRVADEYLPEVFDFASHDADRNDLEQFNYLFGILPRPEDSSTPQLTPDEHALMEREIDKLVSDCRKTQQEYAALRSDGEVPLPADEFEWLRYVPRSLWLTLGEFLGSVGRITKRKKTQSLGTAIWAYAKGRYF